MVRSDYLRMEITDRWKMNDVHNGTGWMNGGFYGQMDRAVQKGRENMQDKRQKKNYSWNEEMTCRRKQVFYFIWDSRKRRRYRLQTEYGK